MKNIINIGNKGMPIHICFWVITISLKLQEPTQINMVIIIRPIETI
jgi:hypothetical protein